MLNLGSRNTFPFSSCPEVFCVAERQSRAAGFTRTNVYFAETLFRNSRTLPGLGPDGRGFGVFRADAYLRLRLGRMRGF